MPQPESAAVLYDIHGNLVALEAVLAEAESAGATSYMQHFLATALTAARDSLGPALVARLYELPERAELDGILVCHGSPLSDIDSFAPQAQPDEERMLVGEAHRTILFGHSHRQFERPGPNGTLLVNPGSVGAPLDGDRRAAWALYENGRIAFRRTAYDTERAAAQMRSYGDWAEPIVRRIEHGAD